MFWIDIKRIIKAGLTNFMRNGFVSLASILIMTVTLFTIGSVLFLLIGLNVSLDEIKQKVDVSVYFKVDAIEEDMMFVQKTIDALPSVFETEYISRDQALENFRLRHEGDELTLQALDELGENPLGAVLNIRAVDPSEYENIANFLKEDPTITRNRTSVIDKVNYFDNQVAIERLSKIISAAEKFGLLLTIILIVVSIIISFNTIRLAIFVSREEISVMKLVGANNKYIRGPFVVSGLIYGLISGLITLIIFYPLTGWIGSASANFFSGLNFFSYYLENFGHFVLILVGGGAMLGALSSFLAVRRYLKN